MPVTRDSPGPPHAQAPGLVVIYGDDLGKLYNLNVSSAVIGRSTKSDIRVDQESISRNHSTVVITGKSVLIRDLGSTNGTYVNDEPIQEYVLRDGDLIKVGRTIFKFLGAQSIERAYHDEMYRLVMANQSPQRAPSVDERAKTMTMTLTDPEDGRGGGGSDE
jgi:pSer/pThr/pTyr-binding forkhead associated (FHA) protein